MNMKPLKEKEIPLYLEVAKIRNTAYVERLAGRFKIRRYSVSNHSYFVGIMFERFAFIHGIEISAQELIMAMKHDLIEVVTGDLIALSKNLNKKTKSAWKEIEKEVSSHWEIFKPYSDEAIKSFLKEEKYLLLKYCDLLELWLFTAEEYYAYNNKHPDTHSVVIEIGNLIRGYKNPYNTSMSALMDEYVSYLKGEKVE